MIIIITIINYSQEFTKVLSAMQAHNPIAQAAHTASDENMLLPGW